LGYSSLFVDFRVVSDVVFSVYQRDVFRFLTIAYDSLDA
jgi:hypothetical protein